MDWNTFISNEFGMPVGWRNMDNESQFFYQPNLLCGVEPNDDMRDNNDENVGGEDIVMQVQPNHPKISSYFITNKVYFVRLLFVCVLCLVTE